MDRDDIRRLDEMYALWSRLAKVAGDLDGTPKGYAYGTAADVLQYAIEDYPGGREWFWRRVK